MRTVHPCQDGSLLRFACKMNNEPMMIKASIHKGHSQASSGMIPAWTAAAIRFRYDRLKELREMMQNRIAKADLIKRLWFIGEHHLHDFFFLPHLLHFPSLFFFEICLE